MTTVVEYYVPEKNRKDTVKLLLKYFDKKTSSTIEKGIYDFTEQFCRSNNNNLLMSQAIYKDTAQNLIFNYEQNCPTIKKLKKMVDKKKYNPYNFAFLRPEELNKDNWMGIILRKNTTEKKLNDLPTIEWRMCKNGNCGSTQYFYSQLQTRSADEPMTIFYTCKKCSKTYKINN